MKNGLYNLADQPAVTSDYAGELALPYIHAGVISAPTIAGGNVTLLEGIRFKAQLPIMATSGLIIAGACDFSTSATTTLTDTALVVTDQMVNLQLCKKQFRTWWSGSAYNNDNSVPQDYADAILLYVAKLVQADVENNIWNGEFGAGSGYEAFDGFKHIFDNGGTFTELVNSISASASVLAGLQEIILAMPSSIEGDFENTKIYVNPVTISAYNLAVGQTGDGYNSAVANGSTNNFLGYSMVASSGIPKGECMLSTKTNLFVGVGSADSLEMAQALDMTALDGSDNYRITMRFAVGCQIGVIADAVYFVNAV
jgi:hypothetical protein